jgi:hypothetical protein
MKQFLSSLAAIVACATLALPHLAAAQTASAIPPIITTPDKVETSIGMLQYKDGAPSAETSKKVQDTLDFIRAVDAFTNSFSGASAYAIREGFHSIGAEDNTVVLFSELMDSNSLFLTPNADTIYSVAILDLTKGPLVVEVPPKALGTINDMWFGWIIDIGGPGPDRGEGASICSCRQAMTVRFRTAVSTLRNRKPTTFSTPFVLSWKTTIRSQPSPKSGSR